MRRPLGLMRSPKPSSSTSQIQLSPPVGNGALSTVVLVSFFFMSASFKKSAGSGAQAGRRNPVEAVILGVQRVVCLAANPLKSCEFSITR